MKLQKRKTLNKLYINGLTFPQEKKMNFFVAIL